MKYAILGPRHAINRLRDTPPIIQVAFVGITDEQATQIEAIRLDKKLPLLIDGEITTREAQREAGFQVSWDEVENKLVKTVIPPVPRELSKLDIKRKLEAWGKWETFKAVLASMPSLDDEFWLAQTISTADPMFTTHAADLKQAVGLTDEQFAELA
jgi:hypothetical protein